MDVLQFFGVYHDSKENING